MMNDNQRKLISILKAKSSYLTSNEISHILGVSTRSIKNYVNLLNKEFPEIIESNQNGYLINQDKLKNYKILNVIRIPQTQTERVNYIIKELLDSNDGKENINDISDNIYVSISTLKRDFEQINKVCFQYQLDFHQENDNIWISGCERNKRNLINYIYSQEFERADLNNETLQTLFPDYDLAFIRTVIIDKCRKYNYIINGYSITNVVLDTVISIDRIRKSFISSKENSDLAIHYHEILLAKEICDKFAEKYAISYNDDELRSFTVLLFSNLLRIDYQKITLDNLMEIVGEDTYKLATKIISETNDLFINPNNNDFFIKFTLHLSNLLLRAKTNYISNNLLTNTIKVSCPLLFDWAVNTSNIIYNETGYRINDDEIAYIALHIGSLLESNTNHIIKCALVIPKYYDISDNLKNKINAHFSNELMIVAEFENANLLNIDDYDIVITTLNFTNINANKCVLITSLFTNNDIALITKMIDKLTKEKEKVVLTSQLLSISSPKYFKKNIDYLNNEQLIKELVNELVNDEFVNNSYIDDIIYRERISSTAFNQVAVPHSLKMTAMKTVVSICIFDKAVDWGNKNVNIVLLFAINENDKDLFHNIFDNLITLLTDDKNLATVIKSSNYEQFINSITNIY